MPSIFKPIAVLASKALSIKKRKNNRLTTDLDTAERVNTPPLFPFEGADCPDQSLGHIYKLLDERKGDGMWRCCQGHEVSMHTTSSIWTSHVDLRVSGPAARAYPLERRISFQTPAVFLLPASSLPSMLHHRRLDTPGS